MYGRAALRWLERYLTKSTPRLQHFAEIRSVVRELVAGPGIDFLESRDVELKGLEGSHRLFAVDLS